MGRPEPCVLFAQTILHSQLEEYVDEVTFSEPVVITACEFLEQNASPSTPNVSLVGATSPPSFALEVFVHCEGESRFRRLCQPFLYSHSSSNVLEVEAIVTNHLVLRGTYRSLTLVVYGNTAEDLGQFNVELDLDNSLANVVYSPSEGKLEDLPPALHSSSKFTLNEPLPHLKSLCLQFPESDMSSEVKQFLYHALRACDSCDLVNFDVGILSSIISSVSSFAMPNIDVLQETLSLRSEKSLHSMAEDRDRVLQIWKELGSMESDMDILSTTELMGLFSRFFPFFKSELLSDDPLLSENKGLTLSLGLVLLLCCSKEGCFHFISNGGMEKIIQLLSLNMQESTFLTLLLVSIIECATRHGIGCEAFLGWWPRGDETIPARASVGYTLLLKLLFEKQRHDIAVMATYVLHRLRFYETLSRFESAVVFVLANPPDYGSITAEGVDSLVAVSSQLSQISKLLNMCGPIEDPTPVGLAKKMLSSGSYDILLSSKATINSIANSKYSFTRFDVDKILLSLIKEGGFFPLAAALLSSPTLRSAGGVVADVFLESATSLESILLSLLLSRSGLTFLLDQAEVTELVVFSLKDVEDLNKAECLTLRQAFVLLSKGFFCHPQDVATITELHVRVVSLVDRLLAAAPNSDELLWLLWELCAISRYDTGRQALLAIGYFPEAVSVLLDALCSYKDQDQAAPTSGSLSSLSLAIFHSAAEIFEVLVTDSTAWSLHSWIGIAVDLHKALHLSSPGSNRKDAPTRLLEWIDAGVVYHRNGAIGLLRYAAVLASGGDAHLSSGSVLVSDSIDAEMVVSDPTIDSDGHIIDNLLGKLVSDKFFEGSDLRSTSIAQLTTAFRILAFISEDPAIAATLFEEGAITLIYVVLVHCKYMLERLSNSYDYLVDEGAELSSTADLLLDRSHEQELIDLMVPSLLLLIHVLGKLKETKEVYRNKKLLKALLQLHREISPKLAACAADLSFPSSAVGLGAVCHLVTSAVAFWPVFGWAPNLFHRLLENVTAKLPVGPKDASSMLALLGDLLPDEGIWRWKSEIPPLSAVRNLSIGSILGPLGEKEVNWYMQPHYLNQLLSQLIPQLESISLVVLNFSTSGLMVMQDMLRVFIVRLSCQRMEGATVLLDPILSWLNDMANQTTLSDMEAFKVHQLLNFLAGLLEHPKGKEMLCKIGAVRTLLSILDRCKLHSTSVTPFIWRIPLLNSLSLILNSQPSNDSMQNEHKDDDFVSIDDCSMLLSHLSNLFQGLPVGKEMLACALAFKDVVSSDQGRSALALILSHIQSASQQEQERKEWLQSPPLLMCFEKLSRSHNLTESRPNIVVEIVCALSLATISLFMDTGSLEGITMLKLLLGLPSDLDPASDSYKEKLSQILKLIKTIETKIEDRDSTATIGKSISHQVKAALISISNILKTSDPPLSLPSMDLKEQLEPPSDIIRSVIMTAQLMPSATNSFISIVNEPSLFFANAWRFISNSVNEEEYLYLGFMEKFVWELPQTAQSARGRLALGGEPPAKRLREGPEPVSSFSRGNNLANASTSMGPTRRDTFRQRKPNTSRPPSMHVDDYVARERNIDGTSIGSNVVVSTQRGRPPSIHVDEFIARQKQNSAVIPGGTSAPADAPRVKGSSPVVSKNNNSESDADKADKPHQVKPDLFDEQEIDIDIDEESGSDDKGLFPQPDDSLQAPVVTGENSPDSVEIETRRSPHIRPEKESSSAHNPVERHEKQMMASPVSQPLGGPPPLSGPLPGRSGPPVSNQPPLPPMPPPGRAMPVPGQGLDQVQSNSVPFGNPLRGLAPPIPGGFPLQPSDVNIPNALMGLQFQQDNMLQANAMLNSEANKFPWNFSPGGIPMRNMPPLPAQPYSNPITHLQQALGNDPSLTNIPASHPFAPLIMNRPMQVGSSSGTPQQRTPPPPPPSVPHPSQTIQQQSLGFAQVPLGFPQQLQFPQLQQLYYQNQQLGARPPAPGAGPVDPVQVQFLASQTSQAGQTSNSSQQQQDSAAALQQYFSSPEAIQSLLSDRDKLCQLLETHPKLMQMLQEKLGQL
ncbi:embryo defective 2016 [Rhynchospora pubera]|uniref:Embryo defective 2016 n=1 Tax=Rhynchospora pubera TaxID=906938 RepID=A0AAV8ESS4_9POAL|nr:embryo defective 2016 [Rhynchospora pubera]